MQIKAVVIDCSNKPLECRKLKDSIRSATAAVIIQLLEMENATAILKANLAIFWKLTFTQRPCSHTTLREMKAYIHAQTRTKWF